MRRILFVRTYIASGNAVLDVAGRAADLERSVSDAIEARYGFRREVLGAEGARAGRSAGLRPVD